MRGFNFSGPIGACTNQRLQLYANGVTAPEEKRQVGKGEKGWRKRAGEHGPRRWLVHPVECPDGRTFGRRTVKRCRFESHQFGRHTLRRVKLEYKRAHQAQVSPFPEIPIKNIQPVRALPHPHNPRAIHPVRHWRVLPSILSLSFVFSNFFYILFTIFFFTNFRLFLRFSFCPEIEKRALFHIFVCIRVDNFFFISQRTSRINDAFDTCAVVVWKKLLLFRSIVKGKPDIEKFIF